jgi:hypothetical protein
VLSHAQEGEEGAEEEVEEIVEEIPEPPFTNSSIHAFKKRLGIMGEIYVNDAPLASLTNSNTVHDIACGKRVMGMHMTEDMRNIAQFFMKKFPKDINSIYYQMPDTDVEYFTIKSSAIIGGICRSS